MRLTPRLLLCLTAELRMVIALPALTKRDADFESVRTGLRENHQEYEEDKPDKYFHESSFHAHYDGRFGATQLPYDVRQKHLTALIQTYLHKMDEIGAETWIMHGSLLGWWWNRKIMPWDSDIDVQISEKSIHHLANYYNMTVHHYKLPGVEHGRNYLLEVNPHYINGSTSDKDNVIDARWVDQDSGLFIDITALRHNKTAKALGIEGAMMCKDKHHYRYDDIFPLRDSVFEGFPAKIPFAYSELLSEEYGLRALSNIQYEGHRFDPAVQEWIPQRSEVPGPKFPPSSRAFLLAKEKQDELDTNTN